MKIVDFKKNRGITLIALIVTIIVLLILAGISIAALTGDNSILKQATNAKEKSDLAQTEERIKLAVNSAYMDEKGKLNYEKLITALENEFKNGNYEITPDDSNAESWTITVGHSNFEVLNPESASKWRDNGNNSFTNVDENVTVKIGDYVDYNAGIDESKIVKSSKEMNGYNDQIFKLNYNGKWRVLGIEDGSLKLISDDEITPASGGRWGYYILYGPEGFKNSISELNNICNLYGNGEYAQYARSVNIDDVDKITGYNPKTNVYGEGTLSQYGNEISFYWDEGTNKSNPYYEDNTSNKKSGNLTGNFHNNEFIWFDFEKNIWNSSKVPSSTDKKFITTVKNTHYSYYPETLTVEKNDLATTGIPHNSDEYDLLFNEKYCYPLASRCVKGTQEKVWYSVFGIYGRSYW